MSSFLDIGVSGLLASQRALGTVGHNIANASTEGFSRQRVDLAARQPQAAGDVFFGRGTAIEGVERQVDAFLQDRLVVATSNLRAAESRLALTGQVNNLLGDAETGLSTAMQGFFDGVQSVADDPASVPARQVLLSEAGSLAAQFQATDARLREINAGVNGRLAQLVEDINGLSSEVASLNQEIVRALGRAQGGSPNDLLDRRDKLLQDLAGLAEVRFVSQDDGAVNVMLGKGQVLVAGASAERLALRDNPLDAGRQEIAYAAAGNSIVSGDIGRGELGGVLAFRDEVLEPARSAVGRLAVGLAEAFNAQHREGMDLDGELGGDFFAQGDPAVNAAPGNAGSIDLALAPGGAADLAASTYELRHDGSAFQLRRTSDGSEQTLSGAGPFTVDGMTITVTSPPAAGDRYLLAPTRDAARDLRLAVTDSGDIAAAAPTRTAAAAANRGDARISAGEIVDAGDPGLLGGASIVFADPPSGYRIDGTGPLQPYTSGAPIDVNGTRVRVSGQPQAGDTFTVEANTGGSSDNRNALLLAGLQAQGVLEGGRASLAEANAELVTAVGASTRRSQSEASALGTVQAQAVAARDSVSGVNLDEEAANLMRFQQSYQAAAEVIRTAQTTFDALLGAVRR